MTATLERPAVSAPPATPPDPCQQRDIDGTRPACPAEAAWLATFALAGVFRDVAPREFKLCTGHAQEWSRHLASCAQCGLIAYVALEPIDRTRR